MQYYNSYNIIINVLHSIKLVKLKQGVQWLSVQIMELRMPACQVYKLLSDIIIVIL